MDATANGIPLRYAGYYHGGVKSNLQVVVYTTQGEFDRMRPEVTDFLNGLEVMEASAEGPSRNISTATSDFSVLSFGAARLRYNSSKWVAKEGEKPGIWELVHKKGDAYAKFIVERIEIPLNSLVDLAFEQIRTKDGSASIISQENRIISGVPVRVVRYSVAPKGVPMTFVGCYYGGKLGAVQVIAFTGRQLFGEYQADFDELFAGLTFSP
jgi:hypothetical protein